MAWGDSLLSTNLTDIQLSGRFPTQTYGYSYGSETAGAEIPIDWDSIALGLMAAGGITSAVDTYNSYRMKGESLRGEAANLQSNAELAELAAQQAQYAGQAQIAQLTLRAGQLKAKQRTGFAAHGIANNVGSAAETLATTEAMKQVDKQTARMNALQQSWGYRRRANSLAAQAQGARIVADANDDAAGFGAFGSLLGTASRVAGSYYMRGLI